MSKSKDYYVVYLEPKNGTLDIKGEIITFYSEMSDLIKLYIKEDKVILNIIELDEVKNDK